MHADALLAETGKAARSHHNAFDLIVVIQDEILNIANNLTVGVLNLRAEQKIPCQVLTLLLGYHEDVLINHHRFGESWVDQEGHHCGAGQQAS